MRRSACILGFLWLAGGSAAAPAGSSVLLKVFDERGNPTSARLRIFSAENRAVAVHALGSSPLVPAHPNFPELGAIVDRQARLAVPDGVTTLIIERGPEYREARLTVSAHADETIERNVRLERWTDMAAKGWWSGDLHVHRDPREMQALMEAADLHWAPTITCFNDTLTLAEWPPETQIAGGAQRLYSIDNCEDERRWGAALFLGVKSPMTLYPRTSEYPSPVTTWNEARRRGAYIDLEKVIWWESPVLAALIPPDSIGVAVNHFLEDAVSTRASFARPWDQNKYGGPEGFARYIFDLYSAYLSAGFRIAASAGSANGVSRNVLGYNRSYVYLGPDFSPEAWMRGQKAGRNFVSNGPMLAFSVNGQLPGSVLADDTGEVPVELACESRNDLDRAEVVLDGESVAAFHAEPGSCRIHLKRKVKAQSGSWILGRCFEKNTKTVRFAQSSPIYFGRVARQSVDAKALLREWVDAEIQRIEQVAPALLTSGQKSELVEFCRKARERYR